MYSTRTRRMLSTGALVALTGVVGSVPFAQAHASDRWSTPIVAGLGDSYAAGEGTHVYYPAIAGTPGVPAICHRSQFSWQAETPTYAGKITSSLPGYVTSRFVACSGATSAQILSKQLGAINVDTDVVYLSMGGNDAHFSDVIRQCAINSSGLRDCLGFPASKFGISSPSLANVPMRTALPEYIRTTVTPDLRRAITAIQAKAPNAKIVWAGYPDLLGTSATGLPTCLNPDITNFGLDGAILRNWVGERTRQVNDVIRGLAAEQSAAGHDVRFVSTYPSFKGHDACSLSNWINGVELPVLHASLTPNRESLHPNAKGYDAYVAAVKPVATARIRTFMNPSNKHYYATSGSVLVRYLQLGANRSILKLPTAPTKSVAGGISYQTFQDGALYSSVATGTRYVRGGTAVKAYAYFGGMNGKLGLPTTDSNCTNAGVCAPQKFQHGVLRTTDANHYIAATGKIGDYWLTHQATFGLPIANQFRAPSGKGYAQRFQKVGMYCPDTGSCTVYYD